MALWNRDRKDERSEPTGQELVVAPTPSGLMLAGDAGAIEKFVADLVPQGQAMRLKRTGANAAAVLSVANMLRATNGEFVRLSPESMKQLSQFGATPSRSSGFFAGVVRSADGSIAHHIEWAPADMSPTQALSIQQAAMTMALKAAMEDVLEAVERVEDKLDDLRTLIRSDHIGRAVGDYRTLTPLVGRVDQGTEMSATDWSTVQHLGADVARDIESLRTYVRAKTGEAADGGSGTRSRADRLKTLVDADLEDMLGALALSEHNYMSWMQLKVAQIAAAEPQHLERALDEAHVALMELQHGDQEMITALETTIDGLTLARGLEGLAPFARRQLLERGEVLNGTVDWFAEKRMLDVTETEIRLPSLRRSLSQAADVTKDAAGRALESAGSRLRRKSEIEVGAAAEDEAADI